MGAAGPPDAPGPALSPPVAGLLLAAGAGSRLGAPKALLRRPDQTPYLTGAVDALLGGGCAAVTVVLGAEGGRARTLLAPRDRLAVVVAGDWRVGLSASLRAGLTSLAAGSAEGALVSLVDLVDVGEEVVARVLGAATGPDALARATYAGTPGHPVLLGRAHWAAVLASLTGDEGARGYLATRRPRAVECGDLATGLDVDRAEDLP